MTGSDLKGSLRQTQGENEERYSKVTAVCVSFHTRRPLVLLQDTIQSFPCTRRVQSLFFFPTILEFRVASARIYFPEPLLATCYQWKKDPERLSILFSNFCPTPLPTTKLSR